MELNNKDWYIKSCNLLKALFKEDAYLMADLIAATSPRKSVRANFNLAMDLYVQFNSGYELNFKGCMPSHIGNILRAFNNKPLSGQKVRAFAENLKGNLEEVTIDVWIQKYFKHKKVTLTNYQYKLLVKKIKRNAKKYNLKPAEYQAIIWEKQRTKEGFKPISFYSVLMEVFKV